MPDINFPNSPSGGDTYTFNNITYTYDGEKWTAQAPLSTTGTYGNANVASYVSSQGLIDLTDISVATATPSGNGSLSYSNVSGVFTFTPADASGSGGSGISNVVEDTTPQLGGNLDGQAFSISTTGDITANKLTVDTAENFSTAVFTSSGHEVNLSLDSTSTNGRAYMLVSGGTGGAFSGGRFGIYDADASLERFGIDSSGVIKFNNAYSFPTADGSANQVLQTDGNGTISFATVSGGGSSYGDSNVATYLNGNLDSHIIPDTNASYDLGSAEYKIRHLFLSDNSLYIGSNVAINTSDTVLQANIDGTVKNIAYEDSTSFQPASSDSLATGTSISISGGDSTALNSVGGNVDINAGSGALEGGQINIGTSSTTQTNIGANSSTKINLTGTVQVNNQLVIEDGVSEKFSSLTGATGVVTHDCDNGHIFYHTSISANFTANFTNLGLSSNYSTNLTLLLNQGVTAYIPNAVQIAGSAQTINWQGGSAPTGTANGIDAVSFTILRDSGSYIVLGQMVDFA